MSTYEAVRVKAVVKEDGQLYLTDLPLKAGETVDVILLKETQAVAAQPASADASQELPLPEPAFTERMARRKAAGWLSEHVGLMVMPGVPILFQDAGQRVWRFPAMIGSPHRSPRGPIGYLDVHAETGVVLAPSTLAQELIRNGEHFADTASTTGN